MTPVTRWSTSFSRTLLPGLFLLTLLLSLATPLHAAKPAGGGDDLDIDDNELEYVEIDEILSEDENAPRPSKADKAAQKKKATVEAESTAEEKEFVDLNQILYGEGKGKGKTKGGKPGQPGAPDRKSMQQEMQSLKDKVLQVNRDLFVLEEDLLYPSSTQINVFVSADSLPYFQLDGVTLKINDRAVGNHLYTERELKAMNRGAVQRLFTGNLPVGEHELVAIITGVGPEGRDYKRAVSIDFEKSSGTKYIELKIEGDNQRQQPTFRLKQWE
jgi:hypothetical protein